MLCPIMSPFLRRVVLKVMQLKLSYVKSFYNVAVIKLKYGNSFEEVRSYRGRCIIHSIAGDKFEEPI